MTTRYTLNPEVREKIPAGFLERWAEALETSNQQRHMMANDDDTAHCCLCVASRLEGATHNEYKGSGSPESIEDVANKYPLSLQLRKLVAVNEILSECHNSFALLNDKYMTHPQISHLITHGWVEV